MTDGSSNDNTIQSQRAAARQKQDATVEVSIHEHAPINILHATQQDFLAGYKLRCVDALGVVYTVQCLRKPTEVWYTLYISGPNALTLKLSVNQAVACYEGLMYKALAQKHRSDVENL